jgi:hypothetical protein
MEQQKQMVKVSVQVRSGAARFRVGVQARSIREALSAVGRTYPNRDVRVMFPIEPEWFFVPEPSAPARVLGHERLQMQAA